MVKVDPKVTESMLRAERERSRRIANILLEIHTAGECVHCSAQKKIAGIIDMVQNAAAKEPAPRIFEVGELVTHFMTTEELEGCNHIHQVRGSYRIGFKMVGQDGEVKSEDPGGFKVGPGRFLLCTDCGAMQFPHEPGVWNKNDEEEEAEKTD